MQHLGAMPTMAEGQDRFMDTLVKGLRILCLDAMSYHTHHLPVAVTMMMLGWNVKVFHSYILCVTQYNISLFC